MKWVKSFECALNFLPPLDKKLPFLFLPLLLGNGHAKLVKERSVVLCDTLILNSFDNGCLNFPEVNLCEMGIGGDKLVHDILDSKVVVKGIPLFENYLHKEK